MIMMYSLLALSKVPKLHALHTRRHPHLAAWGTFFGNTVINERPIDSPSCLTK